MGQSMEASNDFATVREEVAAAVLGYYRLANDLVPTVLEAAWVDALPPAEQQQVRLLGLRQLLLLPTFKRFLLEKRGWSMSNYLAKRLTPEEFQYWTNDRDGRWQP